MTLQHRILRSLVLPALILAVAGSVSGATFVSFNGKYAVQYPDTWEQVDYRTVDYYLQQGQASQDVYRYEAVLAPSASAPFYSAEYAILTVDTVGAMTEKQVDSVKDLIAKAFEKAVVNTTGGELLANLTPDVPTYDAASRTLSVLSTVTEGDKTIKKNLMVMKFYDRGIANFFFYAPDTLLEKALPEFRNIVASFTTDIQSAMPKQEVKVTQVEPEKKKANWSWVPYSGLAIILIILVVRLRRRREKK